MPSSTNQPAGQSSSSSTTVQSPSSRALSMEKDIRYRQDMAMAQAIKADTSAKRGNSSSKNYKKTNLITQKQVQVALEAIDEAEALHHQASSASRRTRSTDQKYSDALALYQKAIQILLTYLKQPASPKDVIDRSTLQARIQTALTDAEQLKETIRLRKEQPSTEEQEQQLLTKQATKSSPKTSPTASSYIASIFSGSKNDTTNESAAKKKTSPTQSTSSARPKAASSSTKNATATRTKKPTKQQSSSRKGSSTSNKNSKPSSESSSNQPTTKSNKSQPASSSSPQHLLSSRNQELHHQILDEFYVPTSTLQKTTWDDVAGLEDVKQALQESVIYPLLRPDLFTGLRRPQNLLLYGPPGTGKTLLVRATASTSNALLFQCSAASLTSKWMGDAEKVVRALFQVAAAAAAQHQTPALLFLDEVDSVLSNRSEGEHEASRRLKTEFMIQMEGLAKNTDDHAANVLCLACTNCPWSIDPAVLRRFPRRLYVPLPDVTARQALLQHVLETQLQNDHSLTKRDVSELAQLVEGYSGSDIMAIASQAAFGPIRECQQQQLLQVDKLRPVSRADWNQALINAPPPSVSTKLLTQYQQWQNTNQAAK